MIDRPTEPAPADTKEGGQKDDNIDDLGRRQDGSALDQPVDGDHETPKSDEDATDQRR